MDTVKYRVLLGADGRYLSTSSSTIMSGYNSGSMYGTGEYNGGYVANNDGVLGCWVGSGCVDYYFHVDIRGDGVVLYGFAPY